MNRESDVGMVFLFWFVAHLHQVLSTPGALGGLFGSE